jgi:polar amino acid transport system substrate-binding protein
MRAALLAVIALFLGGCASTSPPAAVSDLAPTGKLRAAINVGNPILAARGAVGAEPSGVSVDLARELARRLGVPVQLLVFESAGKVVEAGKAGWDIAFVALDPARAAEIAQSPPYVVIEGAYLVRADSKITSNDEVDRKGNRVVVGQNSAYDLFLTRNLKQAEIVRAPTSPAVVELFLKENHEVAAGVKQQLEADARRVPGLRLLPGRFMVINQAMASQRITDTRGAAGARFVREFVEEMKASGFVARALARHKVQGAAVAAPGDAR